MHKSQLGLISQQWDGVHLLHPRSSKSMNWNCRKASEARRDLTAGLLMEEWQPLGRQIHSSATLGLRMRLAADGGSACLMDA